MMKVVIDGAREPSALMAAARDGLLNRVQQLLKESALITEIDQKSNTLLHYACDSGNAQLVQYVLESGLPCFVRNNMNQTPLDITITKRDRASILILLQYGALIGREISPELQALLQRENYRNVILLASIYKGNPINDGMTEFNQAIRTLQECYRLKTNSPAQVLSIMGCIDHFVKVSSERPIKILNELENCQQIIINSAGKQSLISLLRVKFQQQQFITNVLLRTANNSSSLGESIAKLVPVFNHQYEAHLALNRPTELISTTVESIARMVQDDQIYAEQRMLVDEIIKQLTQFKRSIKYQNSVNNDNLHVDQDVLMCIAGSCKVMTVMILVMAFLMGALIFTTLRSAHYDAVHGACRGITLPAFNCTCINSHSVTEPAICDYTEFGRKNIYIGAGLMAGPIIIAVLLCGFITLRDRCKQPIMARSLNTMTQAQQIADAQYSDFFNSFTDKLQFFGDQELAERATMCRRDYTNANTIPERVNSIAQHLSFFTHIKENVLPQNRSEQQPRSYVSKIQFFPPAAIDESRELFEFRCRQVEHDLENQLGDQALVPVKSSYGTFA
jgi:hypothetical protein